MTPNSHSNVNELKHFQTMEVSTRQLAASLRVPRQHDPFFSLEAGSFSTFVHVSSDVAGSPNSLFHELEPFWFQLYVHSPPNGAYPASVTSLYKRILDHLRAALGSQKVQDRAQIVEDVLFGKQSLEIATGIAGATSSLIESLKNQKGTVIIDAGLFLFLRLPADDGEVDIFAKRLTVEERAMLDADPERILRPDDILTTIKDFRRIEKSANKGEEPVHDQVSSNE